MSRRSAGVDGRQFGFLPTKVVAVDLDGPVRTIEGLDGYTLALVLVRLGGEPIGTVRVPVHGDRCPGTMVADAIVAELGPAVLRARLLALLERPATERRLDIESVVAAPMERDLGQSGSASATPSMTVAVCTRDRPALLERCLAALRSVPSSVRVLVIDNAPSTDASARLVARLYPAFDYVIESRPGLDYARNRAIAETTSDVIAFTDDDVVVDDRWAEAVARAFHEEPDLGAVTGLVLPFELETPAQELFERLGGFGRGFVRRWDTETVSCGRPRTTGGVLGARKFGTGANMAFRRAVFDRIGGFDPALGVGTPARGGGDVEMFHRVLAGGQMLRYEPAAIVFHQHPRTLIELESQLRDYGSQWAAMMSARAGGRASAADVRSVLGWYLIKHWPRQLLRAALIPNRVPLELPLAEVRGIAAAAGGRWYRQSRVVNPDPAAPAIPADAPTHAHASGRDPRTEVATVDVASTISLSEAPPGTSAMSVLVTRGHAAIGRLELEIGARPPSDRQLRELITDELGVRVLEECTGRDHDDVRQEAVSRLAGSLRRDAHGDPRQARYRVSIIVASLDRPDGLRGCLESLCRQRSRHEVEVVVVDNNPASGQTTPVLDDHPSVVRVAEPRRGLAYARNAGFLAANGEILVTIDDDVQVPDGWLDLLLESFARNDVMAVCGNIQPIELRHPAQVAFEGMGGLSKGFDRLESRWESPRSVWRAFRAWDLGATANAAFRAEILSHPEIGMMDEALGPGMPAGVGEDSYLLYRIVRAGYTVVYEPTAFVYHRHRSTEDDLVRQLTAYYSGHVAHNLTTLVRDRDLRAVARLSRFAAYVAGTRLQSMIGRAPISEATARAQVRGAVAGPVNYLRSQRRVRRQGRSGPVPEATADTRKSLPL